MVGEKLQQLAWLAETQPRRWLTWSFKPRTALVSQRKATRASVELGCYTRFIPIVSSSTLGGPRHCPDHDGEKTFSSGSPASVGNTVLSLHMVGIPMGTTATLGPIATMEIIGWASGSIAVWHGCGDTKDSGIKERWEWPDCRRCGLLASWHGCSGRGNGRQSTLLFDVWAKALKLSGQKSNLN